MKKLILVFLLAATVAHGQAIIRQFARTSDVSRAGQMDIAPVTFYRGEPMQINLAMTQGGAAYTNQTGGTAALFFGSPDLVGTNYLFSTGGVSGAVATMVTVPTVTAMPATNGWIWTELYQIVPGATQFEGVVWRAKCTVLDRDAGDTWTANAWQPGANTIDLATRTISVNGQSGNLSSNLSFTVAGGGGGSSSFATNCLNATNATYAVTVTGPQSNLIASAVTGATATNIAQNVASDYLPLAGGTMTNGARWGNGHIGKMGTASIIFPVDIVGSGASTNSMEIGFVSANHGVFYTNALAGTGASSGLSQWESALGAWAQIFDAYNFQDGANYTSPNTASNIARNVVSTFSATGNVATAVALAPGAASNNLVLASTAIQGVIGATAGTGPVVATVTNGGVVTLTYNTNLLVGPVGATGSQGPQGIQGIQGNPGATGPAGTNGTNAAATNTVTVNGSTQLVTNNPVFTIPTNFTTAAQATNIAQNVVTANAGNYDVAGAAAASVANLTNNAATFNSSLTVGGTNLGSLVSALAITQATVTAVQATNSLAIQGMRLPTTLTSDSTNYTTMCLVCNPTASFANLTATGNVYLAMSAATRAVWTNYDCRWSIVVGAGATNITYPSYWYLASNSPSASFGGTNIVGCFKVGGSGFVNYFLMPYVK